MKRDKHILGDNTRCCRGGYLIESTKPKTISKKQTFYFREVLLCNRCNKSFTNESAKVIIGSSEDLLLRPQTQLGLF